MAIQECKKEFCVDIVNVFTMFNAKKKNPPKLHYTSVPNTESLRAFLNLGVYTTTLFPLHSGIQCKYKSRWLLQSRIQILRKKNFVRQWTLTPLKRCIIKGLTRIRTCKNQSIH